MPSSEDWADDYCSGIGEANEIKNKIRVRKVANGYAVYARGDVATTTASNNNAA